MWISNGKLFAPKLYMIFSRRNRFILSGAVCLALCALSAPARAAVALPAEWPTMKRLDFAEIFGREALSDRQYYELEVPERDVYHALYDRESRVDESFQVPHGLRTKVAFWLRVYTRYHSKQVVLYDKRHPEVVYDVIDFSGLKRRARNAVVYEILRERKVNRVIAEYRRAFNALSTESRAGPPSALQRRILSAIQRSPHEHSMKEWASSLRSQTGQRDFVMSGLTGFDRFLPRMEQIFTEMNVPRELLRLALVESSFNLRARSRVGATGVWQFMLATGREFLRVDRRRLVDERLSPLKSTVAAARLLRRNHRILGSWMLAVIAYNSGHGSVLRLSREEYSRGEIGEKLSDCDADMRLGWAGRNYYAEFLAMVHAEAYRERFYGLARKPLDGGIVYHRLPRSMSALSFIRRSGVSVSEFRRLNPDVRSLRSRLPYGFKVALSGMQDDLSGLIPRGRFPRLDAREKARKTPVKRKSS